MYIFFHKEIRNDDHCPICRTYYISIHKTLKDALDMASIEYRIIEHDNKDDINILENGDVLWIDEWIRRGNGDKYQIIELKQNLPYNLHQYDLRDCINDEYDNNKEDAKYMVLYIDVDRDEYCPYNISFTISFHNKLEDAVIDISETPEDCEKLGKLDAIWNNGPKTGFGRHCQIVKLVLDKIICLNEFCPQIQPNNW